MQEALGNMLHMTSSGPLLLGGVLTAALVLAAAASRSARGAAVAWVFIWLLLNELVLLFVSYHGDTLGVIRHVLVAVVPLRLSAWILPPFFLDLALARGASNQ
jgi:hypothetical protein